MKGEAAALSVRAQHCQSHYFSTTLRKLCQAQVNVNESGQNMRMLWEDIFVKSVDLQTPATSKFGFIISDV